MYSACYVRTVTKPNYLDWSFNKNPQFKISRTSSHGSPVVTVRQTEEQTDKRHDDANSHFMQLYEWS